ncbi:MAG: hydrolase [Bacteroidota bacterium]
MPEVIEAIRSLHDAGVQLYCWSSGGADYAQASAAEFGLADCFVAFLLKPTVLIDDVAIADWRRLRQVHPNQISSLLDE